MNQELAVGKHGDSLRESAGRIFLNDVATLVAVLIKLDRVDEANQVAEESKQLLKQEDPLYKKLEVKLKSALKGTIPGA